MFATEDESNEYAGYANEAPGGHGESGINRLRQERDLVLRPILEGGQRMGIDQRPDQVERAHRDLAALFQ